MEKLKEIFFRKNNFNFYKRMLALTLALVMIFNLTYDVFAQKYQINRMPTETWFSGSSIYPKPNDKLSQELEKTYQAQEIARALGYTYDSYQKDVKAYAKKNNIDTNTIDISASWNAYTRELLKYNSDYKALSELFNKKTIYEVISDSGYYLKTQSTEINYDGKKYNRIALLHAALHNLATRNNTGYVSKGVWVFSKESEQKFSLAKKVDVIKHMQKIIELEGFYPQDRQALWAFAYNIVENGKKYFDNDTYKADIVPGLSDKDDRQKAEQGKDKRLGQANAVANAISLLPILSQSSSEKTKSAQVIYDLARKVMRDDYGTIAITMGSEGLIALQTEDSLNKLYTLLSSDLYRSFGTEATMYFFDSFSVYEWANRIGGALLSGIKKGTGQYSNAIARRFLYIDPKKNNEDTVRIASKADESLKSYFNVVYTDILEDIGKTLGAYSRNSKVAALNDKLVAEYLKDVEAIKQRQDKFFRTHEQTPYEREKNMHTSLIVGILAETKVKNDHLIKAAKIIYNGSWWDLNEATQRDKNNIAAKYLGAQKKVYNAQKQQEFSALTAARTLCRFLDIFVQTIMMGKLVLSLPSIVGKVGNVASRITRGFKIVLREDAVKAKPVQTKPVQTQPVQKPVLKPAEPAKVTEPVKTPTAEPVKVTESVKATTVEPVAEPAKVAAESAMVNKSVEVPQAGADTWINENTVTPQITQAQIAKAAQNVKGEMLGKYYQRPAAMSLLPFGIFKNLEKRIMSFLTNKPYLSEAKIKKVKDIVDDVAKDFEGKDIPDTELKAKIKEQATVRIKEEPIFTEAEKAELLKEIQPQAAQVETVKSEPAPALENTSAEKPGILDKAKAEKYYREAQEANIEGNTQQSLEYYSKAIEKDFTNPKYYAARADLESIYLKNYQAALRDYTEAITRDPKNPKYHFERGYLKDSNLKDYQGALEDYNEAIRLDPTNARYYFYRGVIKRYHLDNLEGAVEDAEMSVKYAPQDALYKKLILEYTEELNSKKVKAAEEARQAELERQKVAEEARQAKAAEEARQAELARQKAAEEARQAKAAEEARQAELARQKAAEEEAKLKAEKEARIQEEYKAKLAKQKEAQKQARKAEREKQKAAEKEAKRLADERARQMEIEEHISKAEDSYELGDLKSSLEEYEKARELAPNDMDICKNAANIKMQLGDYDGAIKDYDMLVDQNKAGYYYYQRAKAYFLSGNKTKAVADYRKAVSLEPNSVLKKDPVFDSIREETRLDRAKDMKDSAVALMQQGDNLEAINRLRQVVKLHPTDENIALLEQAKKNATAEEYYVRALENQKYGRIQQAYEDFDMAVNKANTYALKAQYSYEQARLVRYAKGKGGEKFKARAIYSNVNSKLKRKESYFNIAMAKYDQAIEYATRALMPKVRAKYLFERAQFKHINADFEGAKVDYEAACKLDSSYEGKSLIESF